MRKANICYGLNIVRHNMTKPCIDISEVITLQRVHQVMEHRSLSPKHRFKIT